MPERCPPRLRNNYNRELWAAILDWIYTRFPSSSSPSLAPFLAGIFTPIILPLSSFLPGFAISPSRPRCSLFPLRGQIFLYFFVPSARNKHDQNVSRRRRRGRREDEGSREIRKISRRCVRRREKSWPWTVVEDKESTRASVTPSAN